MPDERMGFCTFNQAHMERPHAQETWCNKDWKPLLPASESADADEFRGVAEQLWLEADMQRVPRYDIRAAQIAWLANAIKLAVEVTRELCTPQTRSDLENCFTVSHEEISAEMERRLGEN